MFPLNNAALRARPIMFERIRVSAATVDAVLVAVAGACALALGFLNLGAPSLWHDELVHAYVGKSIAETGSAQLPSGVPYYNGTTWNVVLAIAIKFWGMTEVSLRSPSVIVAAINVVLTFFAVRVWLGRSTALVAAFCMALFPWTVAWSREARFYTLQQGLYLAMALSFWMAVQSDRRRNQIAFGGVAFAMYVLAVLTSFHSILFLAGIGVYGAFMFVRGAPDRRRWIVVCLVIGLIGVGTLISFSGLMNPLDKETVLERGGLGGEFVDPARVHRTYYTDWLRLNLGTGFFILALFGFVAMLAREDRRGLYVALAFWIPILLLTFFIGYRRPRFMFFVYPFYVAAHAYAMVVLARWVAQPKRTWVAKIGALAVVLLGLRITLSTFILIGDSLGAASGADVTLARRHPQWRDAGRYVAQNRGDAVVITTTYLPTLYYVGHVDNWYPTRALWWEVDESGRDDLKELEDLQRFIAEHPRGYFLAEWWRFHRNKTVPDPAGIARDVEWVEQNLTRVDDASTEDVVVWSWGL